MCHMACVTSDKLEELDQGLSETDTHPNLVLSNIHNSMMYMSSKLTYIMEINLVENSVGTSPWQEKQKVTFSLYW